MNKLISVIVPIYNVEKYIDRCIESIVNQTYKNLEIILVDDGSPDNCPAICDEWAKKDNRIIVLHKENGGLSDARNAGLKIATGDYISFIDSDDWIEEKFIEVLIRNLIETNSDISSCGVIMFWDDSTPDKLLRVFDGKHVFSNKEDSMKALIEGKYLIQTVWNKLYKREIVQKFLFPVRKINEDEFWTWQVIGASNSVVSTNEPLYHYYQRQGSIMQSGNKAKPYNVIEAKKMRLDFIKNHIPNLEEQAKVDLLYTCLFSAQRSKILLDKEAHRECLKKILKDVKQIKLDYKYLKSLGLKKLIRIISLQKAFRLTYLIQNILNVGNKSNI